MNLRRTVHTQEHDQQTQSLEEEMDLDPISPQQSQDLKKIEARKRLEEVESYVRREIPTDLPQYYDRPKIANANRMNPCDTIGVPWGPGRHFGDDNPEPIEGSILQFFMTVVPPDNKLCESTY
jgi:hypothetical protein